MKQINMSIIRIICIDNKLLLSKIFIVCVICVEELNI